MKWKRNISSYIVQLNNFLLNFMNNSSSGYNDTLITFAEQQKLLIISLLKNCNLCNEIKKTTLFLHPPIYLNMFSETSYFHARG